jgi:hypothetical protein
MILSFSTKFPNGTPTRFIEKIWDGLINNNLVSVREFTTFLNNYVDKFNDVWDSTDGGFFNPKLHTIRKDEHSRWKPEMKIHFTVFNRSKNSFQFAPVIECKSVQKIEIQYLPLTFNWVHKLPYPVSVTIDGNSANDRIEELALNDGFDSIADFLDWFNTDFTGKIIHWTDLKY